jgi:hypothetical protein
VFRLEPTDSEAEHEPTATQRVDMSGHATDLRRCTKHNRGDKCTETNGSGFRSGYRKRYERLRRVLLTTSKEVIGTKETCDPTVINPFGYTAPLIPFEPILGLHNDS